MTDKNMKSVKPDQMLVALYDDFTEFHSYCAFFCDAVSALCVKREELLEEDSVEGVVLFSQWLKSRSKTLKRELGAVHDNSAKPKLN